MGRAWVSIAAGTVVLAGLAAPTIAADRTVHAVTTGGGEYGTAENVFQPGTVTVAPGETVTWVNDGGTHNVKFEDGQFEQPAQPSPPAVWASAPPRRTFTQPGTYRYYCELHGGPGGFGMSGTVVVAPTAVAPGTGLSPPPGSSPSPILGKGQARIESLSLTGRRFCLSRGRRCRRPGVRLLIRLSEPARVRGTLRRRPLHGRRPLRAFGTLDFGTVGAQRRSLRFTRTRSGRRLLPGRYELTILAGQDRRVLRFVAVA